MAEQTLFNIVEKLLMKAGSSISREIGLMYGVRNELQNLQGKLSMIKAVLVAAEEQQGSPAVETWVQRLQDVVYDADNLLDDFATEEQRRQVDVQGRFAGQVSDFFSSSNHLAFRFKMGNRIKAMIERLDDIGNDISKFNFIPRVIPDVRVRNRGRETCSVVEKSHKIVGRDENSKEIIELLMQSSSQENLSFVVIAGMGGLGKTTLAQLVYNDQGVVTYFNLNMWVCVSDDFNVGVLIKNILRFATNEDVGNLPLEQLRKRLQEKLGGKRYLLVLDDVWNQDVKKWGRFITLLPVGANGSKILVTTRSAKVASVIGIDSPYVLEGLKEDESWDLFESLAFKKGEEEMNPNLVAIGKEIVKMCKGVPLVIETLGRILYFKTQESQWLNIRNNKSLVLLGDESDILSVLRLSYDNLPTHLKQCFAYCALFPKNYRIEKKLLVQLWMAQGYIQPSHENERLEDVGDEYFEDLLARSLFQEVEKDDANNDILSCNMHDLIHDLAQSIVKSEVIILTDDVKTISERIHHVSFFNGAKKMPEDLMGKPIRTFFMDSYCGDDYDASRYISSLKCSRAMKMEFLPYKALLSLANLSHLRYLDLSHGLFENLPSAITKLKHLQTLKLFYCYYLKEWPRNMNKLINLRHLEFDEYNKLTYMPRGLGELIKLQTLPLFWVGRHRRMGGLSELKFLNNLRGKLKIKGLSIARGSEAKEANLEDKQYLDCLTLSYWRRSAEATQESKEAVSVMESLQPHPNLKHLFMRHYEGVRFPNWMMNDGLDSLLPNLVTIQLWNCNRSLVLPPFCQLPSLKYLSLGHLNAVEYMKDYPSSAKPFFPCLRTLHLEDLPKSKGWGRRGVAAEQAPSYPDLEYLQLDNTNTKLCLHLISVSSPLKSLFISRIKDLTSLPKGLQHVSTLQTLRISDWSGLATLPDWFGRLTSLTELCISRCPKLTSLPEQMRSLRHLRTLKINYCPQLSERCQKETGEDWPKISHIPEIMIQ